MTFRDFAGQLSLMCGNEKCGLPNSHFTRCRLIVQMNGFLHTCHPFFKLYVFYFSFCHTFLRVCQKNQEIINLS